VVKSTKRPTPGVQVVLREIPPGLTRGLPKTDREAIKAILGVPVTLLGFDELDRAELEFIDERGVIHAIFVDRSYMRPVRRRARR
jgi:hypothetical protein